jgi:hypothetical protein
MLSDTLKHIDICVPYTTIMTSIIGTMIYSILYKDNYRRLIRENKCSTVEPFLPTIEKKYQYTLVLDLDETLIHYVPVLYFIIRLQTRLFYLYGLTYSSS